MTEEDTSMHLQDSNDMNAIAAKGGAAISRADLPDPNTRRWVASRKAAVLRAISTGVIQRGEAIELYKLSDEELDGWAEALHAHGERGLKATATQYLRQP